MTDVTEMVAQPLLVKGTLKLMRLLNIKLSLEVLTKAARDVQKLSNDTGIYKSVLVLRVGYLTSAYVAFRV